VTCFVFCRRFPVQWFACAGHLPIERVHRKSCRTRPRASDHPHLTPRKTPANSQPAWHSNPAPAVRHICRLPNHNKIFSPVGPASSRKRAIRYRSSTKLAFAFEPACHRHRATNVPGQQPTAATTGPAPRATFKSPTGEWPMPPYPPCQRQGRASTPAQANGLGIVPHKTPSPERGMALT